MEVAISKFKIIEHPSYKIFRSSFPFSILESYVISLFIVVDDRQFKCR